MVWSVSLIQTAAFSIVEGAILKPEPVEEKVLDEAEAKFLEFYLPKVSGVTDSMVTREQSGRVTVEWLWPRFVIYRPAALSALRAELELWPRRIDPSGFAVGAMVWSDVAGAAGVFQITRRTHGGKRTFGVNKAGEVRLPVGRSGDGYLTGGSGYREVTAAWVACHSALTELWERELA